MSRYNGTLNDGELTITLKITYGGRMMRSLVSTLFVMIMIAALAPDTASARMFRRASKSYRSTTTTTSYSSSVTAEQVSTAQGVAVLMASYNSVGHFGGNPGYEGCGSGSTQQAAYNNCCYSRSGMATVDVGYAQGKSGMWFCCRRYR